MLKENNVSRGTDNWKLNFFIETFHWQVLAHSSWEKELPKLVFDPRYSLLTSIERKEVFDKYVRKYAERDNVRILMKAVSVNWWWVVYDAAKYDQDLSG